MDIKKLKSELGVTPQIFKESIEILKKLIKEDKKCTPLSSPFNYMYVVISNDIKSAWYQIPIPKGYEDVVKEKVFVTPDYAIPPDILKEYRSYK